MYVSRVDGPVVAEGDEILKNGSLIQRTRLNRSKGSYRGKLPARWTSGSTQNPFTGAVLATRSPLSSITLTDTGLRKMWGLLCLAFLSLHLPSTVMGHGFLAQPRARNVVFNSNYCPHCLNAGGSGATAGGAHGICGDAADGERSHEEGGKFFSDQPQATFRKGGDAEFKVQISANHHGRFLFRICEYTGSEKAALTEACLDEHVLRMSDGEQNPGQAFWYTGPNDPPQEYTMRYKLPKDLTCDGITTKCVLQWYWQTSNSCVLQDPDPPAEYLPESNMSKCGPGNTKGEAFWNCAQIRINEDGNGSDGDGAEDDDLPMLMPTDLPELNLPTDKPSSTPTDKPSAKPGKKNKRPGKKSKPGKNKKNKNKKNKKKTKPGKKSAEGFCAERDDGYHAAPASTGFVRCDGGRASFFDCPPGTAFSEELELCDWS